MSVPRSLWLQHPPQTYYPPLQGHHTTDVCVIGGGITGLTTALLLREAGVDVTVIEARQIASGTTGRSTAKITSQHDLVYHTLIARFGREMAAQYADAQQTALEEIAALVQRHAIDCSFSRQNAYQYTDEPKGIAALAHEYEAARQLNLPVHLMEKSRLEPLNLPFKPYKALRFANQAQFDPVAYTRALAKIFTDLGGRIHEQTRALDIRPGKVTHIDGGITATHIIVASHFPIKNIPGWYFARQYGSRSYTAAYRGADPFEGMWLSTDTNGKSFRIHDSILIVGGADHQTGQESRRSHYVPLRQYVKTLYPNSREITHWSAQDGITGDSIPYIGSYSEFLPGVWVATGFAKWGMTNSMAAAMLLRDFVLERDNPWQDIFSPKRPTTFKSAGIFLNRAAHTAAAYAAWPFSRRPVCTHMGCRTRYQEEDGTWECPCHGSRFDAAGIPIDGPAVKNMDLARITPQELIPDTKPML